VFVNSLCNAFGVDLPTSAARQGHVARRLKGLTA